jgi:hypothetical protein
MKKGILRPLYAVVTTTAALAAFPAVALGAVSVADPVAPVAVAEPVQAVVSTAATAPVAPAPGVSTPSVSASTHVSSAPTVSVKASTPVAKASVRVSPRAAAVRAPKPAAPSALKASVKAKPAKSTAGTSVVVRPNRAAPAVTASALASPFGWSVLSDEEDDAPRVLMSTMNCPPSGGNIVYHCVNVPTDGVRYNDCNGDLVIILPGSRYHLMTKLTINLDGTVRQETRAHFQYVQATSDDGTPYQVMESTYEETKEHPAGTRIEERVQQDQHLIARAPHQTNQYLRMRVHFVIDPLTGQVEENITFEIKCTGPRP